MIIVVDAYNILKQTVSGGWVSERERARFIKQLGLYAKKKGHTIVLVFDGGDAERAVKEYIDGIYVVYSGIHENADNYIKQYIKKHKAYELLLVSSDRDVAGWADRHHIESLDSVEFYRLVCHTVQNSKAGQEKPIIQRVKTTLSDNPELDILMQEEMVHIRDKSEDGDGSRKSSGHQESKKEKQMSKKIKKL